MFDKYNFKLYKETKEQCINRRTDATFLLLNTNIKFIDILQHVRNKYNYMVTLDKPERDIIQYSYKCICLYYKIPLDEIKKRYTDNYDEVEERIMFRIELYKEGWNIEQIERYIYKYLLKEDYVEGDIEYYKHMYYNFMLRIEIHKKEKDYKIGRPPLPYSIKQYIKSKHLCKIRDNMRKKYLYSNEYEKIKDNLFTKEEVEEILKNIKNISIINKVKNLQLFDITIKD